MNIFGALERDSLSTHASQINTNNEPVTVRIEAYKTNTL